MKKEILLVDIGNSLINIVVFDQTKTFDDNQAFKIIAEIPSNAENLAKVKIRHENYQKIIISSVVPNLNSFFKDYNNVLFFDYQKMPLLKINMPKPELIGADCLAGALGAYAFSKSSTLIIDSGTATTLAYVDNLGVYQGGIILPGLGISSKALNEYTAKIPLIWVKKNNELIGKNTQSAVEIGLFNSFRFSINGFIKRFQEFDPKIKIIGTGKAIGEFKEYLDLDYYDSFLIFKGLLLFGV